MGQCFHRVANRSSGGLTGSNLAFLLARIPIESAFVELNTSLSALSFNTECGSLKAAVYVDNLYTMSRHTGAATSQMDLLLAFLRDTWGLHSKADSKRVLSTKGAPDDFSEGNDWIQEDCTEVLGWPIQADGGFAICWNRMRAKMWAAFYSNVMAPGWRKLGMRRRLVLLQRCVAPVVAHFLAVIPPSNASGVKLDRMQRRLVSAAMNNTRLTVESWVTFVRRSAKEASHWVEHNSEWWSRQWLRRAIAWCDHLERDSKQQLLHYESNANPELLSTRFSWAAALYRHHGPQWLADRRIFDQRSAWQETMYSRTGTRVIRGKVHTRFHDGIAYARSMLS